MIYGQPSPFPPSFEGNPWAYAFGLFGDVVAPALAMAVLLAYVFEARRNRQISEMLRNELNPLESRTSALTIHRVGMMGFLTFVVMRTLPDALWMLAWGEVTETTIRALLALDLWSDGFAVWPLLLAIFCWAWGRQVIPQRLIDVPVSGHIPWDLLWKNGRIVFAVFVIAIGVTLGKASA
jgi:hypothetical protein